MNEKGRQEKGSCTLPPPNKRKEKRARPNRPVVSVGEGGINEIYVRDFNCGLGGYAKTLVVTAALRRMGYNLHLYFPKDFKD